MTLASLAGFALVFVVCAWTLSAIGGLALGICGRQSSSIGPRFQRRVVEVVAFVPPVIAFGITAVLVLQSSLGIDHCEVHDHHAHLCVAHGTRWLAMPSSVVMLVVVGVTVLARAVLLGSSLIRGRRALRALHAISEPRDGVRLVASDRAFCFVAGHSPAIYMSTRVWDALPPAERTAAIAHERAHVLHGDLGARRWIELSLLVAAPLVGERVRSSWLAACERLCDARAARASSPPAVASALVTLFRLETAPPVSGLGLTPSQTELAARVEAVLAVRPLGTSIARRTGKIVAASCGLVIACAAVWAGHVHHVFETLLG